MWGTGICEFCCSFGQVIPSVSGVPSVVSQDQSEIGKKKTWNSNEKRDGIAADASLNAIAMMEIVNISRDPQTCENEKTQRIHVAGSYRNGFRHFVKVLIWLDRLVSPSSIIRKWRLSILRFFPSLHFWRTTQPMCTDKSYKVSWLAL